jgi:hypothetical protein
MCCLSKKNSELYDSTSIHLIERKCPKVRDGEKCPETLKGKGSLVLGRTFPLESLREITAISYITPFNRHSYYRKEATGQSLGTNISEATFVYFKSLQTRRVGSTYLITLFRSVV